MLSVISQDEIRRLMNYEDCIGVVKKAMAELSSGMTSQLPRGIIHLEGGDLLSSMVGAMSPEVGFGAKIISVYPDNFRKNMQSHLGAIILFDTDSGNPVCIIHAGEVTRIRTAAASALATDILANPAASRLAVLGYGEQAQAHVEAISLVRQLERVTIWGRSTEIATRIAGELSNRLCLPVSSCATVTEAVADADIVCTTTAAADPILFGSMIRPGCHLNLVGSHGASHAEVDTALVVKARIFADHREAVLMQGGEFVRAKAAGLVDESHILGEIGDIINGSLLGRTAPDDITVYKSLGHVVQDIASARYIYQRASCGGALTSVPF
jgi:ornithine cyclodeaminase